MKKGILFLLAMMSLATVSANNIKKSTGKIGVNYRYNNTVTFIERGVKFQVFLNGDFDFDTHYREPRYVDYHGRRSQINRGVRIERDFDGRVRRVGNVYINYDHRGNVKRIGSVYMRYRFGQLTRVGKLKIKYDRWGNPRFKGSVKRYKRYRNYEYEDDYYDDYHNEPYYNDDYGIDIDINIGDGWDYDHDYFYRKDFRDNYRQFKEDDNFYYYKAKPDAKVKKGRKLLKRKKLKKKEFKKKRRVIEREFDTHQRDEKVILDPEKRENTRRGRRL